MNNMWKSIWRVISIASLTLFAVPALAANNVAGGKLNYRGFVVDMSAVRSAANFAAIESSVKHQIDIVADCGAKPEILKFFRNQEIMLKSSAGDGGGNFSSNIKGVTVDAALQPQEKPIILHELLHAYHFYILPDGMKIQTCCASTIALKTAIFIQPVKSIMEGVSPHTY